MTGPSNFNSWNSIFSVTMREVRPRIRAIFRTLDPTTFPIDKSPSPFRLATTLTTISGLLVP